MFLPLRVAPVEGGEDVRFRTADGLELAGTYFQAQDRPAVGRGRLLPRIPQRSLERLPYADHLRDQGFDLFTFDFRNHGESPSDPDYSPLQWVTDHEVARPRGGARLPPDPARRRPGRRRPLRRQPGRRHGPLRGRPRPAGLGRRSPTGPSRPAGRCSPTSSAGPRSTSATRSSGRRCPVAVFEFLGWAARLRTADASSNCRYANVERAVARLAPRPWLAIHGAEGRLHRRRHRPGAVRPGRRAQGTLDRRRGQAQPLPREGPRGLSRAGLVVRPAIRPAGRRTPSAQARGRRGPESPTDRASVAASRRSSPVADRPPRRDGLPASAAIGRACSVRTRTPRRRSSRRPSPLDEDGRSPMFNLIRKIVGLPAPAPIQAEGPRSSSTRPRRPTRSSATCSSPGSPGTPTASSAATTTSPRSSRPADFRKRVPVARLRPPRALHRPGPPGGHSAPSSARGPRS